MEFMLLSILMVIAASAAAGTFLLGTIFYFIRPLKRFAPFFILIVPMTVAGAFGLPYLGALIVQAVYNPGPSSHDGLIALILFAGFMLSIPAGALIGGLLGLGLALIWHFRIVALTR
jgi:hypothetical protein